MSSVHAPIWPAEALARKAAAAPVRHFARQWLSKPVNVQGEAGPMELRHLRYFVAVAEERNFGRAAARLRLAQPSLSRQIRQLEDEVGAALFDRDPRGVQLTSAGLDLLTNAREALAAAERTLQSARHAAGAQAGRLTVAFLPSILRSPRAHALLRAFRDRHPQAHLEVAALETIDQTEALEAARVQVGFLHQPPGAAALQAEPLWEQQNLLALPREHPLANLNGPLPLALVAAEPFIWFDRAAAPAAHDLIRRAFEAQGLPMRVVQSAKSDEARLSLVAGGLGVTLVPADAELDGGPVVLRRVAGLDAPLRVHACFAQRRPPRLLEAFLAEVRASQAPPMPAGSGHRTRQVLDAGRSAS